MADVPISYKNADVYGRAKFEELDNFQSDDLLAGAEPPLRPAMVLPGLASTAFSQFQVVGIDANGFIAPAAAPDAATPIKAFGIVAHAVTLGGGGGNVHVLYSGCFALDAPLVWGASYNTDAEKLAAFIGAPTPSQIIIRKRQLT